MILVLAVESSADTQLIHLHPNPLALITSIRYGHESESNALAISNLRKSPGTLAA